MTARKLTLVSADRDAARTIAAALQDFVEPPPDALTLFEAPGEGWRIDAYFTELPEPGDLRAMLADVTGLDVPEIVAEDVPPLNWVAISQAALQPVIAGRFTVHGSHDRERVAQGPNAILIDAGEAFGTAPHATTYGCLTAIDRLTRRRAFRRMIDLGCGSGVLAIGAARVLPRAAVIATDMDPTSVDVARANMAANTAPGRIATYVATGLAHPRLRRAAKFDFVVANILADPLIRLARDIRRIIVPGGRLVLSGILIPQAPAVIAAFAAQGFALDRHDRVTGWSTLTFTKR
jgi:ribosomal protein L11 methyltransferase